MDDFFFIRPNTFLIKNKKCYYLFKLTKKKSLNKSFKKGTA